jgi:hypothetical protein
MPTGVQTVGTAFLLFVNRCLPTNRNGETQLESTTGEMIQDTNGRFNS